MKFLERKKKCQVILPEDMQKSDYTGVIYGIHYEETGVFNVFDDTTAGVIAGKNLGEITCDATAANDESRLIGVRDGDDLKFTFGGEKYDIKPYNLVQNVFSRNTGILETGVMMNKSAVFLGAGSVSSFIALELAKAGVGRFLLIDNDIFEYHNICRHQCSISDVGNFKVNALEKRIKEINPYADVMTVSKTIETTEKAAFDKYCLGDDAVIVGGADNRAAEVYANSLAVLYKTPFVSIGCWERAFAGEIFYWLPGSDMPCYKCAIGDGGALSQKPSTNRRIYTTEEDLTKVTFMPGISADINFVNIIGVKIICDILNKTTEGYKPRVLGVLKQFTLICNTNDPDIGGEMAEIFSYPLQVTTSIEVGFKKDCPPCEYDR